MPKLYEYLGYTLFVYSNEHEPVHIHVSYQERESKAILKVTLKKSDLDMLEIFGLDGKKLSWKEVEGRKPLKGHEKKEIETFILKHAFDICSKFEQSIIQRKKPIFERVTKRIR